MEKISEEQRLSARVKASLNVGLPKKTSAQTLDLSEGGAALSSSGLIPPLAEIPNFSLQINFPGYKAKIRACARLVWRNDLDNGQAVCGVEFIGLKESQKSRLRREIIKLQAGRLLTLVSENEKKENISEFFLKDVYSYIGELVNLSARIRGQESFSAAHYAKLNHLNNQIVLKGYCLEELVADEEVMINVRKNFRCLAGPWVYKSGIMKRALEKPRGYPGDYLLLEELYNNRPTASGIGFYFDKYFLNSPYALAIRQRKNKIRETVQSEISGSKSDIIRIFDVGSGSCRHIRELPHTAFRRKTVEFSCLDWDSEALEFCRREVKDLPANVKFSFIRKDIKELVRAKSFSCEKQDLIYVAGLADFLTERLLKSFLRFFYAMLKPGGKLVLTHKNREKTFAPLAPRWFCDLNFIERDKDEITKLIYNCGIKDFSFSNASDEFNETLFFTLLKH